MTSAHIDAALVKPSARRTAPELVVIPAGRFEMGSHTLDHAYANSMGDDAWARQVVDGKRMLEDQLGHRVDGFCYPGGKRRPASRPSFSSPTIRSSPVTSQ